MTFDYARHRRAKLDRVLRDLAAARAAKAAGKYALADRLMTLADLTLRSLNADDVRQSARVA